MIKLKVSALILNRLKQDVWQKNVLYIGQYVYMSFFVFLLVQ